MTKVLILSPGWSPELKEFFFREDWEQWFGSLSSPATDSVAVMEDTGEDTRRRGRWLSGVESLP